MVKFKQQVRLIIEDAGGIVIFSTTDLRVDFETMSHDGYLKSSVVIYNLSTTTIKAISDGPRFYSLYTKLGSDPEVLIIDKNFVSNAMTEVKVPNSITTLYGYSSTRLTLLQIQINVTFIANNFRGIVTRALTELGVFTTPLFPYFPLRLLDYTTEKPVTQWSGTFDGLLKKLGESYRFIFYMEGDIPTFSYLPSFENVDETDYNDTTTNTVTILDTNDIRANPQMSVEGVSVVLNLNGNIAVTSRIDTSQLITAAIDTGQGARQFAPNFFKDSVAGNPLFQVIAVAHRGSNYTGQWETTVTGVRPSRGYVTTTYNWFGVGQ